MSRRILFVVTEDWYFRSHRLALARELHAAGDEVWVATRVGSDGEAIRAAGLGLVAIPFSRSWSRPDRDLASLLALWRCMRRLRPDIVHNVALKAIVLGGLAAMLARVRYVVHAFTGLGYLFTNAEHRIGALRWLVERLLRLLLRRPGSHALLQNEADRALLLGSGIGTPERTRIIAGSGLEPAAFAISAEPAASPVTVLVVARALYDKGIREYVEAAAVLARAGITARFLLVGAPDPQNPASIPVARLQAWSGHHGLQWLGRRDDVPALLAQAQIACLPSYREGLPKALLEAAAAGLPLVATDVPGCREVVVPGRNGLLVPARDAAALAEALGRLIEDPALRARMGAESKILAERFALARIVAETTDLYATIRGA